MKPSNLPAPRRRLAAVLAACAFCAVLGTAAPAVAQQEQAVRDFSDGPPSGRYAFASSTPKTFGDLVRGAAADPVDVVGHLFLPDGTARGPAVVLMHGSGGIYSALLGFWPQRFNAAGIAVLAVDSFGPRGVTVTTEDQSRVPFAADTADAFAALKLLASHPRIDPRRIAVMGFSRGGIAAWRSAVERVIAAQRLPGGLRFAAHVPVYSGGCTGAARLIVKPGVFSKAPMLWLHGDADDYTPVAPCQDYAQRIGAAGTPVDFVVVDGARHKFDSDDVKRIFVRGAQRTLAACPIEVDVDTLAAYDRSTGQRLQGETYQAALKSCGAVGATVEGSRAARDKAAAAAVAFLSRTFGP